MTFYYVISEKRSYTCEDTRLHTLTSYVLWVLVSCCTQAHCVSAHYDVLCLFHFVVAVAGADDDDDDIYEAFDEVAPSLSTSDLSSQRPDLPPSRSALAAAAGIEEELYEDTDEAVNQFTSTQPPAPGPALPPRGSIPSGPPLPQRNPVAPPDAAPPLPPRPSDIAQTQNAPEEIYEDTEEATEEPLEIYDDVEAPVSVPVQKEAPRVDQPPSPKSSSKGSSKGKGSPKQSKASSKPGKRWSPFSRSKKPQAPAPAPTPPADVPEEVYDDVEAEQPPSKPTAEPSPLVNAITSPPEDVVEELYDDMEGATSAGGDDLYLPMELEIKAGTQKPEMQKPETKKPEIQKLETQKPEIEKLETKKRESTSPARRFDRPSSPVVPVARSGSFNATGPRTRMGTGKVADMMKKFQQEGGNDEIKCKGRLDHMPPGKNAFQKAWCQLEGSTVAFYRSSRDAEPTSKLDARECELSTCTDDFNAKFCLQLSVGAVSHKLNLDSKREFDKWMACLEEVAKKSS